MKKTWLLLFAALLLPVALLAKTTTIYHTSDVHGFFFPRNGQGGFAALEAVLKKGPQNYLHGERLFIRRISSASF